MRKLFCALLLISGFFVNSSVADAQITYGVKGGISVATFIQEFDTPMREGNIAETSSVTGFAGGAFAKFTIPLLPFSIQPEILYVRKGGEGRYSGKIETSDFASKEVLTLDYVEIPVLLKFNIPVPLPVTPSIFAGPTYSYLVGSEKKVAFTMDSQTDNSTFKPISDLEKHDFGVAFGGELDFNVLATKLTLDARYTLGLAGLKETEMRRTLKNRAWIVMLGVAF
ncbi:MAG: porin family protein [Bacteroidota bacterium]